MNTEGLKVMRTRFEGDMRYTNLWKEPSEILPDFTGLVPVKKEGKK